MTTGLHTPRTARLLFQLALGSLALVAALCATHLATAAPAAAATRTTTAYGWPVKPFHRQHPIRGAFGDPRILGSERSFHFGVDVSCPNGTEVYATIDGTVALHPLHSDVVIVRAAGDVSFSYWHIAPLVRPGQQVTAYRTVLGRVLAPWEHVHFAEAHGAVFVNPLRPGAMSPYLDRTTPRVRGLTVESAGVALAGRRASGRVDLVVEAYDATPLRIAGPWGGKPVTPALLEWRLVGPAGTRSTSSTSGWRTAIDFRTTYPANDLFASTYARWTRQNKRNRVARYRFYLQRGLDTTVLRDGRYSVQVRATDIRGNATTAAFGLTVANV